MTTTKLQRAAAKQAAAREAFEAEIRAARASGKTLRQVADEAGVSYETVRRIEKRVTLSAEMFDRRLEPLFTDEAMPPARASALLIERCPVQFARQGIAAWHSRLPLTQTGPWKLAMVAHHHHTAFAVALWHNPSARTLPADWLELRRLAVAPDAPHCTASRMLGQMARWIRIHLPDVPMLLSYQDEDVHTGTIYRAAGWYPAHHSNRRVRDRSKPRVGTQGRRDYRSNLNGVITDSAPKTRWQLRLTSI